MLVHFCGRQLTGLSDFDDFVFSETNDHILGLEIGVDDFAHPVHVVQANQALPCQLPDQRDRDSFVVITFDNLEEVYS